MEFDQLPKSLKNMLKGSAYSVTAAEIPQAKPTAAYTPPGILHSASGVNSDAQGMFNWLIDSGATHSMTPYRHNYVTFNTSSMTVRVANGESTSAEGYGDVLVDLKQDGKPTPMLIKNVWFVPQLDTNLLSVAELGEDSVTVYINAPNLPSLVLRNGKYLGLIHSINRKYWLSTTGLEAESFRETLIQNNIATALAISSKGKQKLSMRTWHRRLGHLGLRTWFI